MARAGAQRYFKATDLLYRRPNGAKKPNPGLILRQRNQPWELNQKNTSALKGAEEQPTAHHFRLSVRPNSATEIFNLLEVRSSRYSNLPARRT